MTYMAKDKAIIQLEHVELVRDRKAILSDFDLTIDRGDFMAVTGPNGGGKTTLMRIILKLLRPTRGTVTYFGADGQPTDRLAIGYLPQKNTIDSRFPITVREVVESGIAGVNGMAKQERRNEVERMLRLVELDAHAGAGIGTLSGGQLQRALMARAIISRPEVLVLDEPLSYVDKRFEHTIYEIVARLAPSTTIILVSHDMSRISSMANRHIIVDHNIELCHSSSHFLHYESCEDEPDRRGSTSS